MKTIEFCCIRQKLAIKLTKQNGNSWHNKWKLINSFIFELCEKQARESEKMKIGIRWRKVELLWKRFETEFDRAFLSLKHARRKSAIFQRMPELCKKNFISYCTMSIDPARSIAFSLSVSFKMNPFLRFYKKHFLIGRLSNIHPMWETIKFIAIWYRRLAPTLVTLHTKTVYSSTQPVNCVRCERLWFSFG